MKNIEKYFSAIDTVAKIEQYGLVCSAEDVMENVTGVNCCGDCDSCYEKVKEWLFAEAEPDKPKLTRFEKQILLNLEGNYKYICRDKDGNLYVYEKVPGKQRLSWVSSIGRYDSIKPFNSLFDMVSWDDEWPTEIAKLLELEVITYED